MSEKKHTPGPWRVGKVRSDCAAHVFNEDGEVVASAHQWPDEEHGPNAHLIAAAPEMLEAHEDGPDLDWYADRLVNVYGESEGADFIIALRRKAAKARAAIKKARGEK